MAPGLGSVGVKIPASVVAAEPVASAMEVREDEAASATGFENMFETCSCLLFMVLIANIHLEFREVCECLSAKVIP